MKRFISINENFLPDEMYRTLRQFAETTNIYDTNLHDSVWNQRVVHFSQTPEEIKSIGREYIKLVKEKIMTDFELETEVFTDVLCFNRWRIGDMQLPHADDENEYHWRKFGCVFYLNEEYTGGQIGFIRQDTMLKPKANTLVFFPGDAEFLHGVRPINNGIRYTISTFWTYDASKEVII